MTQFKNGSIEHTHALVQLLFLHLAKFVSQVDVLRRMVTTLGQCTEYRNWQCVSFTRAEPLRLTREQIWLDMLARVRADEPIVVWEFGVAWGYTTNWWLQRFPNATLVWHGFDRFTGLPRAWRNYEQGTFNADGKPPDIDDKRVQWHVGDVEDRLTEMNVARQPNCQWIVLFDLDLYEPTKFAWQYLAEYLRPGDLLYFDEAFDTDERRLLDEDVVRNSAIKVEFVASNPTSLALQVESVQ